MWKYDFVTRKEFESVKDKIEEFIVMLGGKRVSVELPYVQNTVTCTENGFENKKLLRPAFEYNGEYYRVDGICFDDKPYIVIECGTYQELMMNCMDDADPFPYDLTDEDLLNEVKYSLEIEPYPEKMV